MEDKLFYQLLDEILESLMKGAKYISIDVGKLNDVCMEITRRKKGGLK